MWEERFTYQGIAEILDISINTVRTQITVAVSKLRKSLEHIWKRK